MLWSVFCQTSCVENPRAVIFFHIMQFQTKLWIVAVLAQFYAVRPGLLALTKVYSNSSAKQGEDCALLGTKKSVKFCLIVTSL